MKKLLLIALCAATLLSFAACSKTDYDITEKDNIYEDMSEYIANPEKYEGKSVTLKAKCLPVYNFSQNKIARHAVVVYDDDSDMRAIYEIRSGENKYPKSGTEVTLSGIFTDGYIQVTEYKDVTLDERKVDIDTLTRNADELKTLIETYREEYEESKYYGKTVRIYGHIVLNNGYPYLVGCDKNGNYIWHIELKAKDSSVAFPKENTDYINTYEIVGTFETFVADYITSVCITVDELIPVEGVLYIEGSETDFPMTNPFT